MKYIVQLHYGNCNNFLSLITIHLFIILIACPSGSAGVYPSDRARGGVHLRQVASLSQGKLLVGVKILEDSFLMYLF